MTSSTLHFKMETETETA